MKIQDNPDFRYLWLPKNMNVIVILYSLGFLDVSVETVSPLSDTITVHIPYTIT
jgi:hypothetical protein